MILVARRLERLENLATELNQQHGIDAAILQADLASEAGIQAVEEAIHKTGDLSLLVNNAGFGLTGGFRRGALEKHLAMIQVHVTAAVRLTHLAVPGMVARKHGGIINVSSISAFFPLRSATYSATKAFLVNFSEALQGELYHTGVRVQALCPGFTNTEFHDTEEFVGYQKSRVPGWLWLKGEDVVRYSLRTLVHGPVVCIPGLQYKFARFLGRGVLTSSLIQFVARKITGRRY